MMLCLLVGGPDDGRFFEFPDRPWRDNVMTAHVRPIDWHDVTGWEPSQRPRTTDYDRHLYEAQKIACPDGWTVYVYVHAGYGTDSTGENEMACIDIVMRHWRELNRRKAERLQHAQ